MYLHLHLGNGVIIDNKDIVGIFDLENTTVSKYTKEFLRGQTEQEKVINVTKEIPKAFIVTSKKNKKKIKVEKTYLSQISTTTLNRRNIIDF